MSPESQRIAIAEACGWQNVRPIGMGKHPVDFYGDKGGCSTERTIPDYLNDLNAMHSAEQVREMYSYPQRERYLDNLMTVVRSENIDRPFCCATAAQRCEAFLKTLGLWK